MSVCERLALVFLLISPLISACGAGDTCVRNSDCRDGLGCNKGRCAIVNPPPPSDASRDSPVIDAPSDAGGDRDASVGDAPLSSDAADASIETDAAPEIDAADAGGDVTDAGSDSSD